MLKFVIPAVAVLGLTAFAVQSYAPGAAQVRTPSMAWHISQEGTMAKLAYGIENSDLLALMITCAPGDRSALIYGDMQPAAARLTQASLGATRPDPLSGGDADETRISLRDPVLLGLAKRGSIRVSGDAGEVTLGASRKEQRAIGGFLAYCADGQV